MLLIMKNPILKVLKKIAKEHNKCANAILFKIYEGLAYRGPEYENTVEYSIYRLHLQVHLFCANTLTSFIKLFT